MALEGDLLASLMKVGAGAAKGGPAGAAIAAVPEVIKVISAARQRNKAKALEQNLVRPKFEIPGAAKEALDTARAAAYDTRIPNQDYITGQLGASTANSIRAAQEAGRTGAEILQTIASVNENHNEAIMDLAMKGADQQRQDMGNLYSQLNNMAGYQQQQFQYDKADPYQQKAAAAGALRQAANENLQAGVKGLASAGITALTPKDKTTTTGGNITASTYNNTVEKYGGTVGGQSGLTAGTPAYQKSQASELGLNTKDPADMNWYEQLLYQQKLKGGWK